MKKKTTCRDELTKRFANLKVCPFSHTNYTGNPPERRRHFCLIWNSLVQPGHEVDTGYLITAQAIGKKACSRADMYKCPLFGANLSYAVNLILGILRILDNEKDGN